MADTAITMPHHAAEPPGPFLTCAETALNLLATAIEGEKVMGGIGQFEPEHADGAEAVSDLWHEALDAVEAAAFPKASNADEERLKQVMIRLASVIHDLDTAGVDPVAWLEVHDLEKSVRSEAPSRAIAMIDTTMLLLSEYLDLMDVIDIEDRV